MKKGIKSQQDILNKLKIEALNPMQEEALLSITSVENTILLSPTGTGKTVAFLLPLIQNLSVNEKDVQLLILVPSRELAIQIEQVMRDMGTGFKVHAVYGGRHFSKDKAELTHTPTIIVGTPGRVADHLRRGTFSAKAIHTLVLDEFDKSLEVGFELEMKAIIASLPHLKRRVLTSATKNIEVPRFLGLKDEIIIDYLDQEITSKLELKTVVSKDKNKLETLKNVLYHIGYKRGIIFCNFKDTINYVSRFLEENGINHGTFSGSMEQKDRERTLIKFRNGTHQIIIATDLAARGLDIPELGFIIHYQLPLKAEEFTHRNGRTARMNAKGTAYILQWEKEMLPEFINSPILEQLTNREEALETNWVTLFISGGRKDKVSKGDIAGLILKQCDLEKSDIGVIELKQDCAFVAVNKYKAAHIVNSINNYKLKKKKIKVYNI